MKFVIKHEIRGRIRFHVAQKNMSYREADMLQYYLDSMKHVSSAKVNHSTCDAIVCYEGNREAMITALRRFHYETADVPESYLANSGRQVNEEYKEKLVDKVLLRCINRVLLPVPIANTLTAIRSVKYITNGLKTLAKRKIEVPVLDGTAIGVSVFRGDFQTAGSIMFLLGIGEILEEWTHKKSVGDLARSMSLNIGKVWLKKDGQEVQVSAESIHVDDEIVIHVGNVIPFDGTVVDGDAMVNQASMTGEPLPVHKQADSYVYAGTVLEEGELCIRVRQVGGSSRYEKVVTMIEESEKLKSSLESKASHLADKLVPYTLLGTAATYLFTRNVTKALSVLMVDFSCALKLAMPISVLSAIRQASKSSITVKGGKFLEAMAEADTIVFDKTGTLTKGTFAVNAIHPENITEAHLLDVAAAAESYSTHPVGESIVAAHKGHIDKSRIGKITEHAGMGLEAVIDCKTYFVGNGKLMDMAGAKWHECHMAGTVIHISEGAQYLGHIVINDEIKPDSADAIAKLKELGIKNTVMLTGDNERVAEAVGKQLGLSAVHAKLLPSQKVERVEELLGEGNKVAFVGDGINDAPVLTRADVGIAMGAMGSDAAIESADIVLMDDKISKLPTAIKIARKTMRIVNENIWIALAVKVIILVLSAFGIADMWIAVFGDVGVLILAVLNAMRAMLKIKDK